MSKPQVLVTGASGYIALHLVKLLQQEGYPVRGTVRSLTNKKKLNPILNVCPDAKYPLELVEADLTKDDGWTEAVKGCQYVMHVASPFPNVPPNNEEDLLKPAVEGTTRVLKACAESGTVKRLVLTSSICSVHGETTNEESDVYSEKDWTDTSSKFVDAYAKSKTLAEKYAWDYVKGLPQKQKFELVTINPGLVLGPILSDESATSTGVIYRMMSKITMPLVPSINFPICDVRDVAMAHYKAITVPEAAGQRHVIVSDHVWMLDMAKTLAEEFNPQGYSIPVHQAPFIGLWLYSFLDKSTGMLLPRLDKVYTYDNKRMLNVLGIKPKDSKDTLIETSYSLIERGLISKSKKYKSPAYKPSNY